MKTLFPSIFFTMMTVNIAFGFSIPKANIGTFLGEVTNHDRSDRVMIAQELKRNIQGITDVLPSLTPSEEEWLTREIEKANRLSGEASTRKLESIISSPISSRKRLIGHLEAITKVLIIIEAEGIESKQELLAWNLTAFSLSNPEINECWSEYLSSLDSNDMVAALNRFHISNKRKDHWLMFKSFARYIQLNVITSIIRDEL